MAIRRQCIGCDKWFTPVLDEEFCERCSEELNAIRSANMNAAIRMTLVRSKLREKKDKGLLGVIAATAAVGEGRLSEWLEKPALSPSRDELTRVEKALGLHDPEQLNLA